QHAALNLPSPPAAHISPEPPKACVNSLEVPGTVPDKSAGKHHTDPLTATRTKADKCVNFHALNGSQVAFGSELPLVYVNRKQAKVTVTVVMRTYFESG
ncbi:hypothetical protein RRG08_027635, partial [Elysia crispata]